MASGLIDAQARTAACPPSALTVAGVVAHLGGVERSWFAIDFAGDDLPRPWTSEDPHGEFVTHLIGETARHCGHLDLLRDALDVTRRE